MNTTKLNLKTFYILLFGQSISILGTGMTRFAVMIWAYEQTRSATALALLGFFNCITYILASPFAGVLVDRLPRRKVMFFADLSAGLMTAMLLVIQMTGELQLWHLYLAIGLAGIFEAFQDPAFTSTVSLLVPKDEYVRSNGMLGMGRSVARMLAPIFAGLVQQVLGLNAVLSIDIFTMSIALLGLLMIRIPGAPVSAVGVESRGSFWQEVRFGMAYIFRQAGLRNLTLSFFLVNLFATLTYFAVLSPMILARTGGDETALGIVRTAMGIGGITGGALLVASKSPQRKARMYLLVTGLSFLICDAGMAVSRSVVGWSIAGFLAELTIPFLVSPYYALWQETVPPDVQGRVFSIREMIQIASQPIGFLLGGLMADRLFEPAMQSSGWFSMLFGGLVGTGPGAGMASMFLLTSVCGSLLGFLGLLLPSIRRLDEPGSFDHHLKRLPDQSLTLSKESS
ncbi:MAG TPA: MFS transporter [Anaerolineales bacterium]|nr:MFS transporter [Anaerolineales bacterium]